MKKYRVHFFDKASSETRSLEVYANNEEEAEIKAEEEADRMEWPKSFKISEAEELT